MGMTIDQYLFFPYAPCAMHVMSRHTVCPYANTVFTLPEEQETPAENKAQKKAPVVNSEGKFERKLCRPFVQVIEVMTIMTHSM